MLKNPNLKNPLTSMIGVALDILAQHENHIETCRQAITTLSGYTHKRAFELLGGTNYKQEVYID